jgi:hypothetical protein
MVFTLLPIALSVLLRFTASGYLFCIFAYNALSVFRFTASDYLFGIFTLLSIALSVQKCEDTKEVIRSVNRKTDNAL